MPPAYNAAETAMFSDRTGWNRQKHGLTLAVERSRLSGLFWDLTRSNPTECAFHYDERGIQHALAAGEFLRYRPEASGMAVAREAVAAYYKNQNGVALAPD